AFGLPVLDSLDMDDRTPQAIILCPTRELCIQIAGDIKNYAKHLKGISILPVYGGSSISLQIKELKRGVHVIVGTPGRVNDMIERGAMKLGGIRTVVLDEADEMLNMGFRDAIDTILAETPETKLTWLFSATMPDGVARIAKKYMNEPATVSIKGTQLSNEAIAHFYTVVQARDRYPALRRFIDAHPGMYGIVFCRTKAETQEVADKLVRDGYPSDSLHGDLSQAQRDFVMKRFRSRIITVLVATDVAARGLDVDDVTHVFHYQAPDEPESYTHRSGRTGRAGKSGISIMLMHAKEQGKLRDIERRTGKKLTYLQVPSGDDAMKNQVLAFAKRITDFPEDKTLDTKYLELMEEAMEGLTPGDALRRLVSMQMQKAIDQLKQSDLNVSVKGDKPRERREIEGDQINWFVSVGSIDGLDPSGLLRMFCDELKVNREHIGRIDLKNNFSFVQTIALDQKMVEDAFKGFSFQGREVRVNVSENTGGGFSGGAGRSRERGEGGGERKSYGGGSGSGRKSFGEKKSYGGDRKSSFGGEKKSYGKSYGEKSRSFGDRPATKSFGGKSGKPSFGDRKPKAAGSSDGGDWKALMGDTGGGDRKKKFGKKKW
ncbi:MAG TPA: DEAD/DEAH box helicase, partial [Bacteroidia bacterium]|nr:DEAD/DEAH box helicase [Bacteroidia bacterium]